MFTVGLVVAAVLALGGDATNTATSGATTTQPATTVTSSTTTTTPVPTTTTTTTTPRQTTTTTVPSAHVPGIVVASAGSSGGSGEVAVVWKAAARATGYRVYLTDSAGRTARLMADINIVTGRTKSEPGVIYVRSDEHAYIPNSGTLTSADRSSRFQYIDYDGGARSYRAQAYNAAGAGALSAVITGTPVIGPPPTIGS